MSNFMLIKNGITFAKSLAQGRRTSPALRRQQMNIGWDMATYMGVRATRELEVVSHNLANSSTAGFKRELLNNWQLTSPEHSLAGHPEAANYVDVRSRDFNQGSIHETGRETDLAIQGPGFFKVQTPRGVRYTRNGSFHLSSDFELITKEGYLVLGKDGPITLDSRDKQFGIDSEGGIHLDKNLADRVYVVDFPNSQDLRADGQTYLVPGPLAGEAMEAKDARLHQGSIEESNVDLVAESIALVDIHRRYEGYLKVLETFAASDRKVVEEIGQQA
jgi:flagellar basal-body rod protein FlgF